MSILSSAKVGTSQYYYMTGFGDYAHQQSRRIYDFIQKTISDKTFDKNKFYEYRVPLKFEIRYECSFPGLFENDFYQGTAKMDSFGTHYVFGVDALDIINNMSRNQFIEDTTKQIEKLYNRHINRVLGVETERRKCKTIIYKDGIIKGYTPSQAKGDFIPKL